MKLTLAMNGETISVRRELTARQANVKSRREAFDKIVKKMSEEFDILNEKHVDDGDKETSAEKTAYAKRITALAERLDKNGKDSTKADISLAADILREYAKMVDYSKHIPLKKCEVRIEEGNEDVAFTKFISEARTYWSFFCRVAKGKRGREYLAHIVSCCNFARLFCKNVNEFDD